MHGVGVVDGDGFVLGEGVVDGDGVVEGDGVVLVEGAVDGQGRVDGEGIVRCPWGMQGRSSQTDELRWQSPGLPVHVNWNHAQIPKGCRP